MRISLALLCLPSLALAVPALAQGQVFLNFNDCYDRSINKNLDCANTTATTTLVASATPAVSVTGVIADLGYIDVEVGSDPAALPPFWQFQEGGCAGSSRILFSADFTTNLYCVDVWRGLGSTAGQWGGATGPLPEGNRARLKWSTNVTPDQAFQINFGEQAYIERITLRQAAFAICPGCNSRVCAVYMSETLNLLDGSSLAILGGVVGTEFLFMNDPMVDFTHCPVIPPDPVHNSTWGQVKSLYR